jgi:hypothetical protein
MEKVIPPEYFFTGPTSYRKNIAIGKESVKLVTTVPRKKK